MIETLGKQRITNCDVGHEQPAYPPERRTAREQERLAKPLVAK